MDTTLLPWKKLILYMEKNRTVTGDWKLVGSRKSHKIAAQQPLPQSPPPSPSRGNSSGVFVPGFYIPPDDMSASRSTGSSKRKIVQIQTPPETSVLDQQSVTTLPKPSAPVQSTHIKSVLKASGFSGPPPQQSKDSNDMDVIIDDESAKPFATRSIPMSAVSTNLSKQSVSVKSTHVKSGSKASGFSGPPPKQSNDSNDMDATIDDESAKPSATRIPTSAVSTNDGTHRLSVKWKLETDVREFAQDRNKMFREIHTMMTLLFDADEGLFYRWESEDLKTAKSIHDMKSDEIGDFISPKITTVTSTSQLIFGVRFGFASNPSTWLHRVNTKEVMKINQVSVSVSNSKSNSGRLVIAGYILLKHPTMTHKHRYLQHLRKVLPPATPYFDVVYRRQSPMDQSIGHLAVQCGENHVTTVCQALVKQLTGHTTSIFLPRYVFATASQGLQFKKQQWSTCYCRIHSAETSNDDLLFNPSYRTEANLKVPSKITREGVYKLKDKVLCA